MQSVIECGQGGQQISKYPSCGLLRPLPHCKALKSYKWVDGRTDWILLWQLKISKLWTFSSVSKGWKVISPWECDTKRQEWTISWYQVRRPVKHRDRIVCVVNVMAISWLFTGLAEIILSTWKNAFLRYEICDQCHILSQSTFTGLAKGTLS